MDSFSDVLIAAVLGLWFWFMFIAPMIRKSDSVIECHQHTWVMDKISDDLRCSECGMTVEELKWSDKDHD